MVLFKRRFLPVLVLFVLLAGCRGDIQTTVTANATQSLASAPSPTPGAGCTVVSVEPTPGPTEPSLFPAVTSADWVKGPEAAEVTIVEYSDFQCAYCAGLAPVLAQIEKDFPQNVRVVFRHYPQIGSPQQPQHDKAALSMQAAEAAGAQGRFWEMHDLLYARQSEWMTMTVPVYEDWLAARSAELGLDPDRFLSGLHSPAEAAKAQKAYEEALQIGIPKAPFLLINGQIWSQDVPPSYANLSMVVRLTILEERQFTACPVMAIDPEKQYTATLHTVRGEIVLQLYPRQAPMAVNSFIFLARSGWYDGVTFHRVLPGFVAQAGDPTGTGYGGPGYAYDNEISPDLKFDSAGVLGMANSGPGSNGSQFFITYAAAPKLNGSYTIFGKVIAGMDVLESLTPRDPSKPGDLPPGDTIESVTIEEK